MIDTIRKFTDPMQEDRHCRNWSWDHCYNYFQTYRALDDEQQNDQIDLACLNLAFYLASWGMYRGSTFVLQKDYKIYEDVVKTLNHADFANLWNVYYENLDNSEIGETIEKVFCLKKMLTLDLHNHSNGRDITDTLISKIIMGTMGCVPAYDELFKKGLRIQDVRPYSSFSINSFRKVIGFCVERSDEIQQVRTEIPQTNDYPTMKIVDMYFWVKGSEVN